MAENRLLTSIENNANNINTNANTTNTNNRNLGNCTLQNFSQCKAPELRAFINLRSPGMAKNTKKGDVAMAQRGENCLILQAYNNRNKLTSQQPTTMSPEHRSTENRHCQPTETTPNPLTLLFDAIDIDESNNIVDIATGEGVLTHRNMVGEVKMV